MNKLFIIFLVKIAIIALIVQQAQSAGKANPAISPKNNTRDLDLNRNENQQFMLEYNILLKQQTYAIGQEKYAINIYQKSPIGTTRYLVLHDNENTAFDSGLRAIKDGGLLVVLENKESRYLYDFGKNTQTNTDPNRIFDDKNKYFALGQAILSSLQLQQDSLVVALHNNSPNSAFKMSNIHKFGNAQIVCQKDRNEKNLYWIPYKNSTDAGLNLAKKLCNAGSYNVVSEQVPSITEGDGSLSIYAANHGIDYVNIEIKAAIAGDKNSENTAMLAQQNYITTLAKLSQAKPNR